MTCTHIVPETVRRLQRNLVAGSEKNLSEKFPNESVKQCLALESTWRPAFDAVLVVEPIGPFSGPVAGGEFRNQRGAAGTVSQKP